MRSLLATIIIGNMIIELEGELEYGNRNVCRLDYKI